MRLPSNFCIFFAIWMFAALSSCTKDNSAHKTIEKEIDPTELPQSIQHNIRTTYLGATLVEADEIILPSQMIIYDVLIKTSEGESIELTYDSQGRFLGPENENNQDEEEEDKEEKED